jgi:hypothetical protein
MRPFDEEQQLFARNPLDDEAILSGRFWAELRVFLAVAKTRSLNRAAEIVGTSRQTVSRQIKRRSISAATVRPQSLPRRSPA